MLWTVKNCSPRVCRFDIKAGWISGCLWVRLGSHAKSHREQTTLCCHLQSQSKPILIIRSLVWRGHNSKDFYQEYVDISFSVFLTAWSLVEPKYQQEANSLCRTDDPCCPSITVQSLTHIYFLLPISPQACFLDSLETRQTCQRFLLVKDLAMCNPLITDHSIVFKPKRLPCFLIKREKVE